MITPTTTIIVMRIPIMSTMKKQIKSVEITKWILINNQSCKNYNCNYNYNEHNINTKYYYYSCCYYIHPSISMYIYWKGCI
jgi:hypothetical protein